MSQNFILSFTSENSQLHARIQGGGPNYTAMISAKRKTPRLVRGLVFLKAGSKADSSYISEFHSAHCQRKQPAARTDAGRRTKLHCNGWRSAKTAPGPTSVRICESESWDLGQQFLRVRILFLALLAKNCSKCTKQLVLLTDAFSNH